jgi:hypothetical protein
MLEGAIAMLERAIVVLEGAIVVLEGAIVVLEGAIAMLEGAIVWVMGTALVGEGDRSWYATSCSNHRHRSVLRCRCSLGRRSLFDGWLSTPAIEDH